jgi:hypothetical protein
MPGLDWARERRRGARVDLLAELQGHVVTLDETITVRQVGPGGLTIETTAPLSARVTHDFRVTVDDRTALVRARLAHSRVQMQGDAVSYLSGLEFVEPSQDAIHILDEIVARAHQSLREARRDGPR